MTSFQYSTFSRYAKAKNTSPWTLLPGNAAVFFGNDYFGDARIETIQPGQELTLHLGLQLRQRHRAGPAAVEGVLGLRLRKAVQHRLPHRELVEVGVQQTVDDGFHRGLAGQDCGGNGRPS